MFRLILFAMITLALLQACVPKKDDHSSPAPPPAVPSKPETPQVVAPQPPPALPQPTATPTPTLGPAVVGEGTKELRADYLRLFVKKEIFDAFTVYSSEDSNIPMIEAVDLQDVEIDDSTANVSFFASLIDCQRATQYYKDIRHLQLKMQYPLSTKLFKSTPMKGKVLFDFAGKNSIVYVKLFSSSPTIRGSYHVEQLVQSASNPHNCVIVKSQIAYTSKFNPTNDPTITLVKSLFDHVIME